MSRRDDTVKPTQPREPRTIRRTSDPDDKEGEALDNAFHLLREMTSARRLSTLVRRPTRSEVLQAADDYIAYFPLEQPQERARELREAVFTWREGEEIPQAVYEATRQFVLSLGVREPTGGWENDDGYQVRAIDRDTDDAEPPPAAESAAAPRSYSDASRKAARLAQAVELREHRAHPEPEAEEEAVARLDGGEQPQRVRMAIRATGRGATERTMLTGARGRLQPSRAGPGGGFLGTSVRVIRPDGTRALLLPSAPRRRYSSGMATSSRTKFRYDFAIYDDHGRLAAVLEAKRRFGTDSSWAQAWHETLVENMDQPGDVSVVLITPDRIYAWRPGAGAAAKPDWVLDAVPRLAPYFNRLKISAAEVHPHVFEQVVGMWLRSVTQHEVPAGAGVGDGGGLLDIFRGGRVVEQDAA
ncbi:hypothetical protein AB3662_08480 [Sorangium cellulosum]|uniref:hypothetical protein n=1 Tax=Sorangium cellulosum TaxID=56 RepID=UPI003D9A1FBD